MGLNLRGIRVNADAALSRRKPFKPNAGFRADPVPAARVGDCNIEAWKPGIGSPDPVPAGDAEELTANQAWRPGNGVPDPIPARSVN